MQVTVKSGSVISLPFGDAANITSNNSAVAVSSGPHGELTLTAAQPGDAELTIKIGPFAAVTVKVKVIA